MRNWRTMVSSLAGLLSLLVLGCGNPASRYSPTSVRSTANPLVAQYTLRDIRAGVSAWVEFGPDTNYGRQTSVLTSAAPGDVNILVAGMKAQTKYHMRAHLDTTNYSWVDEDQTFTTGAIPSDQPLPHITADPTASGGSNAAPTPAPGIELLSLTSTAGVNVLEEVVTDLQGNVIWFCPGSATPLKLMQNGHMILVAGTDLLEMDLSCNIVRDVSMAQVNQSLQSNGYSFTIPPTLKIVPGGAPFHHDVLVLPNGHWIGLCEVSKDFSDLTGYTGTTTVVGDALVDIDLNGNVAWAWSSFDHLDVNRHPYFGLPDWTHSNAMVYTADGDLLLSMRAQSWIIKIDYANGSGTGDIVWRLGPDGDFTLLGGDATQWFYSQHYPDLISAIGSQMILGIWDNGNFRTDSNGVQCGTSPTAPACYSRSTIFQVDESTKLATLLWQDLPGFYSFWGGSIGVLSNGNVEFDMSAPTGGSSSQIMEVTQTETPQTVWQLSISDGNAYRGYRIPSLYPGVTWMK
jgi:arylsulfate sulfotransferase